MDDLSTGKKLNGASSPNPENPDSESRGWYAVLLISLAVALSITLVDSFLLLIRSTGKATTILLVFRVFASKFVFCLTVYWIIFALLSISKWFRPIAARVISSVVGVFLAAVYGFYALHQNLVQKFSLSSPQTFLLITGGLLIAMAAGIFAYHTTRSGRRRAFPRASMNFHLAAPVFLLLIVTALAVNMNTLSSSSKKVMGGGELISSAFTPPLLFFNLGFLILFVILAFVFVTGRANRTRWGDVLIFGLAIVLPLSSIFADSIHQRVPSAMNDTGGAQPVPHVILIMVDTLRADALSCYGNDRVFTPSIDRLADDGILFQNAYAEAPWTNPSIATIMSGLSPSVHLNIHAKSTLPDHIPMWAEYMQESGYLTHAIVSNPFLYQSNFAKGFRGYDFLPDRVDTSPIGTLLARLFPHRYQKDSSKILTNLACHWLKRSASDNFFLWLLFYDPHQPYTPPQSFLPPQQPVPSIGTRFSGKGKSIRGGYMVPKLEERAWIQALYEGEVRYVDFCIGRIIAELHTLGIYESSLILLVSDHGEEFWDHNQFEHGHTLFNELLAVPLIIKLPQSSVQGTVDTPISVGGLMPTVLELCQIPFPDQYLSNDSLAHLWAVDGGGQNDVSPVVSTGMLYYEDKESIIFGNRKFIHSLVAGQETLFDLEKDALERYDVSTLDETGVEQAKSLLEVHRSQSERIKHHYGITSSEASSLDPQTQDRLRALGYIQ